MRLVRWNSVRVRLTLWNAGLLVLLLAGSGIVLCYRVQTDLLRSVDQELADDSDRLAARPPGHDAFGPPEPPNDRPPSPGGPAGPSLRLSSDAERRMNWRRPRLLTPSGEPWGPFPADRPWDRTTLTLSAAGATRYSTLQVGGEPMRVYSRPVTQHGRIVGVVQAAHPVGDLQRVGREQLRTLMTLIPVALLAAVLLGVLMTDRTLRPVRQITQAAAQIGTEDLSRRLEVTSQDEFGVLAATFNGMIGRLEQAFTRLENAYRGLERAYEQQRRFTADASHELRTPLARIKGSASLALAEPRTAEEYCGALRVVNQAADVMNRLIRDLLMLARADAAQLRLERCPLSVAELLADVSAAASEEDGCPIRVQLPDEPVDAQGDRDALARLLVNLIENARRHTPPDGEITLAAHADGDNVVVRVEDSGEGIAPEHLPHVCDRFYRVDVARTRSRGGTGLGLAICRSIAEAHGGTLTLDSVLGRGTIVSVTLPRAV
jgi:signal transduction histidine kinase